jgi:glycine/D-amino acid oxidase-like deaminating enzyme/nitrite reductase/ring-hydroxylating ferredoxin subunit
MTSLWLDRPRPVRPALDGDTTCDVVVVGAGITGLTTAVRMAGAGLSVVVLEGRTAGAATTGNTTAKVSLLQGTKLRRIRRAHPLALVESYVEANRRGQEWLVDFCRSHGVLVEEQPAVTYATTRVGELRVRAELEVARQVGLAAEWTDDPGLPFAVRGAVRLEDQFQLHPVELVDALADDLETGGGRLFEHSRVHDVSRTSTGVRAETGTGTVTARHLVVATSMPVLDRGGFFARQVPQRSYAAALRPGWVPDAMYLSADSPSRSIRRAAGQDGPLLLVGGHGHVTGRVPSEAQHLADLLDWARTELGGTEVTHTWSAQDHGPAAELPYVGPLLPGDDRLLVATGFDKWGFTNAPAAAGLLTSRVTGRPRDAGALESWSPWEATGLPKALAANGSVGLRMAQGWLRAYTRGEDRPVEGAGVVGHEAGRPVATCTVDGVTHRVSAVCPHLYGVVSWNDAEKSWDCPLHGSRFAPDGSVLEGPTTEPLAPRP